MIVLLDKMVHIGPEFNVSWFKVCPDDGVVTLAPDQDDGRDDDDVKGMNKTGITKVDEKYPTFLN